MSVKFMEMFDTELSLEFFIVAYAIVRFKIISWNLKIEGWKQCIDRVEINMNFPRFETIGLGIMLELCTKFIEPFYTN